MRDLKAPKVKKAKNNRRKKQPFDWKGLLHRVLRVSVALISLILLVGGGGLLAKVLFDSSYFRVDTVRVENRVRTSEEEIVALSDVRPGNNIFELDLARIGRKIEENPWVQTARVQRVFPRTVVIRVEERSPRAVINLDYLYYLDTNGEIFKVLEAHDSLDYPVVTGVERKDLLERPEVMRQKLQEVIELIDELQGRKVFTLADVSEIHVDPSGELVLYTLDKGVPVRLGRGDYRTKFDHLERIYPELQPRLWALKYIDLNVMDKVIVKVETGIARRG